MANMCAGERQSDRDLWESAVRGDGDAFGVLFTRHHKLIYNFCFRRTGSWTIAEDLTAVVFLEAWRTRRRMILRDGSLLPWLYGIATNVTRHHSRSTKRYHAALERLASRRADVPDQSEAVADRLVDEHRMRRLLAAFEQLPNRERDVLELATFGELDYAGIAATLGIPVGTVRSRLSRARSRLQRILAAESVHTNELEELRP